MSYRKVPNQIPPPVRNALISIQNCKLESNPPPFPPKSPAKLSTNLIKAYFDNGLLKQARQVFDEMPERDVVAWTAMISGYASCNRHTFAWMMFKDMLSESLDHPNEFTFSSVLKACKSMKSLCYGALSHGLALRHGFVSGSMYVDNALLDMYATCCVTMEHACLVFREIRVKNQVSWTTLMTGFTHRNDGFAALEVFRQMSMEDAEQCPYSFSIAVRACAGVGSSTYGQQLHASVFKHGFHLNIPVMNSILDMYCKCDYLNEAYECFNGMNERDEITWNTLIAGYEKSDPMRSLHLFLQMGCTPNCFTYSSVIAACTNLSVLRCGQQIHGGILKRGLEHDLLLANPLIDMYAKSGSIEDSSRIFHEMPFRDLFSWTSMMVGFGSHGYGKEAVGLFDQMVSSGIQPDRIVFMAVLTACSHAGLVDEGLSYFKLMTDEYGIVPDREIYACVIDLLGRGGRVEEAYDMILGMRFEPDESIWAAFLGGCKAHGQPIMGKMAVQRVLDLRPRKAGVYVMLANMYTAEGKWGDRAKMRTLINDLGSKKVAGRSWVEVQDRIYSFVAGDGGCSNLESVDQVLRVLGQHMIE
ncbi:hypothetical protein OSB04_014636 [Centaurea solstitialis]|uniref:Pentatricopeptide repeat-containing protein n=1 Tax=Centaurea solstitialis TaxID=347529 RepID=A0AA38TAV8_9ASTR|nr:hypothetical protein OSB04_014636 [Centaurea solstitialis]